jgi:hypothetical protein
METGYIPSTDNGHREAAQWNRGIPETSWFYGLKYPDEQPIPVRVYRCGACGFLEAFANPEFEQS